MSIVNGSKYFKGTLSAKSLLFKEFSDSNDETRGANFDLINGQIVYQIDSENKYTFLNQSDINTLFESYTPTSSTTITQSLQSTETKNLLSLLNVTFFSINDDTKSHLINMNFDFSDNVIPIGFVLDKVNSSNFRNGYIEKNNYQIIPTISISQYKNEDIIPFLSVYKMDNSAISRIDQTILDNKLLNNVAEQSSNDISAAIDLLILNSDDSIFQYDTSGLFYNKLFSINQINYNLNITSFKSILTYMYNNIFANDPLFYWIENYSVFYKDSSQISRTKLYFFNYAYLIENNIFYLMEYIKKIYNNTNDYSNVLSAAITDYKTKRSDITECVFDYSAYETYLDVEEIINTIFDCDCDFKSKIKQSDLDITVSLHNQSILALNNASYTDIVLSNTRNYIYDGSDKILTNIEKMRLSSGQFQVPLIEIDLPINSYFEFIL